MTAGDAVARAGLFDLCADDVVPTLCQSEELAARLRAVVRRARGYASSDLAVGVARLRMGRLEIEFRGLWFRLPPGNTLSWSYCFCGLGGFMLNLLS